MEVDGGMQAHSSALWLRALKRLSGDNSAWTATVRQRIGRA
ncbi:hypothetical protein IL54_0638 [Sphingobium sp. ba1]|nr:hypothetical protein IL54_0638 [Sphingobium sp. ba1]